MRVLLILLLNTIFLFIVRLIFSRTQTNIFTQHRTYTHNYIHKEKKIYVPCFVVLQSLAKPTIRWSRRGWSEDSRRERFSIMTEVKIGRSRLHWESCTSSSNLRFKVCLLLESMNEEVQKKMMRVWKWEDLYNIYIVSVLSKFPSKN